MAFFVVIKVTPNASKNEIVGWNEDQLRLRIRGVPEKGQVNNELIAYLAKLLGVSKTKIQIISGSTSRLKRLKIEGITQEEFYKNIPE